MKKALSILAFSLFTIQMSPQTVSIKEGSPLKPKIASNITNAIGQDLTSFYMLRMDPEKRTNYWVEKFNKQTLNLEYSTPLNLLEDKEYLGPGIEITPALLDGEVVVLYDLWNKDQKKGTVYCKSINKAGAIGQRKVVKEIDKEFNFSAFEYHFSKDKTAFVVITQTSKDRSVSFNNTKSAGKTWTKPLPKDINGLDINIESIEIESSGDIKFCFWGGNKKEGTYKEIRAYLKSSSEKLSEIIEMPSQVSKSAYKYSQKNNLTKEGVIIIGGMYYDKNNSPETAIGTFISFVNSQTGKIMQETYSPLESDIYKKLTYSVKFANTKDQSPAEKGIIAKEIVEMNGNHYVVSEHEYTIVQHSSSGGDQVSAKRELIITKYSSDGKYEWMRIVPKFEVGVGDYNLMKVNNKLSFIYLENAKNKDMDVNNYQGKDIEDVFNESFKANIVCTSIDEKGNMTKAVVPHTEEKACNYVPQEFHLFFNKDNDLLIEYIGKAYNKFCILTLN